MMNQSVITGKGENMDVEKAITNFQDFINADDGDYDASFIGELAKNDLLRVKGGTADLIGDEDNLAYPDELDVANRAEFEEHMARVRKLEKEGSRNVIRELVQVGEVHAVAAMSPVHKAEAVENQLAHYHTMLTDKDSEEDIKDVDEVSRVLCREQIATLLDDGLLAGCSIIQKRWVRALSVAYTSHFNGLMREFADDIVDFDKFLSENEICKGVIETAGEEQEVLVRAFFEAWIANT